MDGSRAGMRSTDSNLEVKGLYRKIIEQWLSGQNDSMWYMHFITDLLTGNVEAFEDKLQQVLLQTLSSWDVATNRYEAFYHGFVLGLIAGVPVTHEVRSNKESGRGRYDVVIIPKDPKQLGIILEFKFVDDETELDTAAQTTLQQIDQRGYDAEFQQRGIQNS